MIWIAILGEKKVLDLENNNNKTSAPLNLIPVIYDVI